jgi:hypothetical protein
MVVTFDDGTSYKVEAKARDLLAAERNGEAFDAARPLSGMYAIAQAALARMQRVGDIPADVKLPATSAELGDVADVEGAEDPKG